MADRPEPPHTDDRLARLLDVERRLETRVRQAEASAVARVAAAREAAQRAGQARGADFEANALAEEQDDLQRHAAALRDIATESAARIAHLSAITGADLERLALRAVAVVLSGEEATSP
jgi:hypothetical protein